MNRKFGIQAVSAACLVLVACVGFLLWKALPIIVSPVPAILDLSEGDTRIHLESNRQTVLFEDDCIRTSWRVDNIRAISVNDKPKASPGQSTVCGNPARFRIELKDGSTTTYSLPRTVLFARVELLICLALIGLAFYVICSVLMVPNDNRDQRLVSQTEIRPLTSLRGFAALLVFFLHYQLPLIGVASVVMKKGLIGVTIFFVLSGFLIAGRYMDDVATHSFRWRRYLIRRAARILPVYYTILLLVALWQKPVSLANLTLTQAFFPNLWRTGILPAWTLTVEESFYWLLPVILWLCWRTKRPWLTLGIAVIGLYLLGYVPILAGWWPLSFMLTRTICGRMIAFAMGIGCAYLYREWRPGRRAGLLTLLCCVGFIFWAVILKNAGESETIIYGDWVAALFAGGLLLSLTSESGWIVRVLRLRPFVYAGRISYALYLIQLTPPIAQLHGTLQPVFGNWTNLVLYGVVSLICIALYECVEKPVHRWILRRFDFTPVSSVSSLSTA